MSAYERQTHLATRWVGLACVALAAAVIAPSFAARSETGLHSEARPQPLLWPGVFSAQQMSNRSDSFSLDKLWYDWDFEAGVGRQIIRIARQDGSLVYDVMPGDGNAYYINVHEKTCKAIKFGVSILTPYWQVGGVYMGEDTVDGVRCYSWRKNFGIQCTSFETLQPVQVTFNTSYGSLHPEREGPAWTEKFLTFEEGDTAPEELYTIPDFCPPPAPLPDDVVADVVRRLTADPVHPPHILLQQDEEQAGTGMGNGRGMAACAFLKQIM
eukprot:CAMPEP_0117681698 /NCGR_PEP_ID=MMETSP0804-20121206/19146_1 /TAXON_ID=1074897 /ORGANISM="Tetraselmis astigmatica, Strain CCMP880" /LENGTH=268 /DNA_ID=CAMNT_0005491523 /DNA_START=50 /DNA_END=857 /DNA_ORIENTATION=-